MKDQKQSQNQAREKSDASGTAEEGADLGVDTIGRILAQPRAKGRAWDVMSGGELTLGNIGRAELSKEGSDVEMIPARGIYTVGARGGSMGGSHGSIPEVVLCKTTIGIRAMLVQGYEPILGQ